MSSSLRITSKGIRKILKNYNPSLSIAEYIWNGFDAKANMVSLDYIENELGGVREIKVTDNGYGIDFDKISAKFNPFYESEKAVEISLPKHSSVMHGKNGVGRLTFFTFAHNAIWTTTSEINGIFTSGSIEIGVSGLHSYIPRKFDNPISNKTGTEVTFNNILISEDEIERVVIPFLICEFCWFLELNKDKNFAILINGKPLDYSQNIEDYQEDQRIIFKPGNLVFTFKFVQWKQSLHKELSKYYFINNEGKEVYKDFTTFNKKGDEFYHSIYVESNLFNNFSFNTSESSIQFDAFSKTKSSPEYKFLLNEINQFLREKRKPFLHIYSSKLVEQYEQEGIFPSYDNEWERQFKKPLLEETIRGLYEAQPKLFVSLNIDQKKTFVRLLDLILDSNEKENLFKILDEVIDLDTEERQDLANLFKTTRLNRITECVKLIEDRYKTYYQLKDLVFNPELKADEVHHLQKVIESHYWLFGEQYHLVTAAEPKFDEALKRYHYLLYQEDLDKKIDHPNKYKEMDIFACRQNMQVNKIENIVIELKHPKIKLGRNQYIQVDKYLETIVSEPLFNAPNMTWEFYLVGSDYDTSGFIERLIETNANHGIQSLIHWSDKGRVKIYAKKWSEIFTDFEIKHKFLDEKLKLEREQLTNDSKTANEVVKALQLNSAIQLEEVQVKRLLTN